MKKNLYSKKSLEIAQKGMDMIQDGIFRKDILPNSGKKFSPAKALKSMDFLANSSQYKKSLKKASK